MSRFVRWYLQALEKHPWKVQITTTGLLMGGGDMISQLAIEKRNTTTFDKARSARFFLYGFIVTGPALRMWYVFLDKTIRGAPAITALKRVALDQTTFAPMFCGTFIFNMAMMRTFSVAESIETTKQDFIPVMKANYSLWPAVQLINMYAVPLQHRVLFVNVVALFWNTFLAWRTEAYKKGEQTTDTKDAKAS